MVGEHTPRELLETALEKLSDAQEKTPELHELAEALQELLGVFGVQLTEEQARIVAELKAAHEATDEQKREEQEKREAFEAHFPPGTHRWWSKSTVRKWDHQKALAYLPASCFKMEVVTSNVAAALKLGIITQKQIDECSTEETQWSLRIR